MSIIENRNKAIIALIGALLLWGQWVVDSPASAISSQEWMLLGWGLAGVVGVERVKNKSLSGE